MYVFFDNGLKAVMIMLYKLANSRDSVALKLLLAALSDEFSADSVIAKLRILEDERLVDIDEQFNSTLTFHGRLHVKLLENVDD